MSALDSVSIAILLGSLLVLAGILSSLLALRFGAPLLLVFLFVGMLAGENGPGGIRFDDVGVAYTVGSVALALILFDGGLRTRFASIRSVLAPSVMLATVGVLVTTLLTAPVAKLVLGIGWIEALLLGAVVASTDAAAVFFLLSAGGLRLRPRVRATLEVEFGTNDPFAIFLALLLVEILSVGGQSWSHAIVTLIRDAALGAVIGYTGGRAITFVLNRVDLPQGLHAPFVAVSALVVFAFGNAVHASGFLAVYLAGLVVGNRQIRAHNSVVAFLDAITWLAQIVMFVLLGLLVWPGRLGENLVGAIVVALVLMLIARPAAVFLCLWPFNFQWREKLFISWVGLRGAVAIFLASIPLLVGLPGAAMYFDVAFVVVVSSLLIQGWTVALSARKLDMSFSRADPLPRRVELDLPGQMSREIVGYPVPANSPFLKRGLIPNWARPTLVIRKEEILTPIEADASAGRRLRLSAGAAGESAGVGPLLHGDAAAARARSGSAWRLLRAGRGQPRRAGRHLWPTGRGRPCRGEPGDILYRAARPPGQGRRHRRSRPDRASGAQGEGRPGHHGRTAARRAGSARDDRRARPGADAENPEDVGALGLSRCGGRASGVCWIIQAPPNSTAVQNRSPATVCWKNGTAST